MLWHFSTSKYLGICWSYFSPAFHRYFLGAASQVAVHYWNSALHGNCIPVKLRRTPQRLRNGDSGLAFLAASGENATCAPMSRKLRCFDGSRYAGANLVSPCETQ